MANGLFAGGDGTRNNPFLIEDADDLWEMRKAPYGHYRLVKTVDVRTCSRLDTSGWENFSFMGTLDGNGFAVTNLWYYGSNDLVGMFSYLRGSVKNLQMIDFNLRDTSGNTNRYLGALAAVLEQSDEKTVENCAVIGGILSGCLVGSFFGDFFTGTIINSYSTAKLEGRYNNSNGALGGITGCSTSSTNMPAIKIKNCYFDGEFEKMYAPSARTNGIYPGYPSGGIVTIEDSYYNILLPVTSSYADQRKTAEELRTPETFVGWDAPMANHLQKVWSIKAGQKPELFYNASSVFLVYAGGKYLKVVEQDWVEVLTPMADEDTFMANAMTESALGGIPGFIWNKLREYGQIELVNMSERYRINPVYRKETLLFQRQVADKFILSKTINLTELGDSLNRVYLER